MGRQTCGAGSITNFVIVGFPSFDKKCLNLSQAARLEA